MRDRSGLKCSKKRMVMWNCLAVEGCVFEAVDHAKACDHTFSLIQSRRLDEQPALRMYELFYQNTGPGDVGRYFDTRVIITGSRIRPRRRRNWMERWSGCLRFLFLCITFQVITKFYVFIFFLYHSATALNHFCICRLIAAVLQ